MIDRIIQFIVSRCRWLAVLCIISTMIPFYFLKSAKIDNSIEVWLGTESKEFQEYRDFLTKYGNEEFVVAATVVDDPLGEEWLTLQKSLADRLKKIESVENVLDVASIAEDLSDRRPDWKTALMENDFFDNLLFGDDEHISGMIVWLKKLDDPAKRRLAVEEIESVFYAAAGSQGHFFLAGTPLMNVALDRGSQDASRTFLPIALAMSVVILFAILRNIKGVIAVMCAVGATTLWTVGLLVVSGNTLNMVTVVLPSLIFVLSLSSGIHISSRYLALLEESGESIGAIRKTLGEVFKPVLLSSVTTSVGFASLIVSDMQPVIDFGIFAAIGMLLSFFFNIMVVPGMLLLLRAQARKEKTMSSTHFTSRIGVSMFRHKGAVLVVSIVLLVVFAGMTAKSSVESNVLKFFPDDSRINRDYHFIGSHLTGFYTVELDVTSDMKKGKELLKQVTALGKIIESRSEVSKVLHYGKTSLLLRDLAGSAFLPLPEVMRNDPFRQFSQRYISKNEEELSLRMSIFIHAMSSREFYSLLDFIDQQANQEFGDFAHFKMTGVVPLLNAAQQSLIDTQIRSFAIAVTVVLALVGIFMRSFRAMIASVLPNILPIFGLFAIMVLLHISLDAATVMIATVAIGIAADDTIHFLTRYREERLLTETAPDAIAVSFQKVGRAITFTSIVAAAGFLILCLAKFKPIQYFGLLASMTMVMAWIGDVFILPACVSTIKLWERK